jgi:hypothetical protein
MPNTLPLLVALFAIVFFYLRQFHASGEIVCATVHRFQYPSAYQIAPLEPAPIVQVDASGITLNGLPEGKIAELGSRKDKIVGLFDDLTTLKNNYVLLHSDTAAFPGSFILAADRDTPFWVIERARHTAMLAGYRDMQYAVWDAND